MLPPITYRAIPVPVARFALPSAAVFFIVLTVLVLRLPEALVRAEFYADDGYMYGRALAVGSSTVVEPYAGFLVVGQRAVVLLETLLPPHLAPLLGSFVALTILAGVAAMAASPRMPWDRRRGLAIAVGIALLPASYPVVGNLAHIIWPVMLWMTFTAVSSETTRRRLETTALATAGLTGPGAIILWPLFLRGPRRRLLTVSAVGAVQLVAIALSQRTSLMSLDATAVPYVAVMRLIVTPLLGPHISAELLPVAMIGIGAVLMSGVGLLLLHNPHRRWLAYVALAFPFAGVLFAGVPTGWYANADLFPRYFWIPSAMLVILIATSRLSWPSAVLALAFALGVMSEARIEAWEGTQWSVRSSCIGGPVPCEVPVAPMDDWNVHWAPPATGSAGRPPWKLPRVSSV
jgi:hypothetical protein